MATSALERCFGIGELVGLVCAHLEQERIDLLSLARVSKHTRAAVLPFFLGKLSISLASFSTDNSITSSAILRLFDAHPALINHVRFVRILYDHTAADDARSTQYRALGRLLRRFEERTARPLPLFDITVNIKDLFHLLPALDAKPGVLARIAALRIDDVRFLHKLEEPYGYEGDYGFQFRAYWEDIASLVQDICNAQDQVGSTAFRLCHIEDSIPGMSDPSDEMDVTDLASEVMALLAPRIHDFSIRHIAVRNSVTSVLELLEKTVWSALRRFRFFEPDDDGMTGGDTERFIKAFIRAHPQLDSVCVETTRWSAPDRWTRAPGEAFSVLEWTKAEGGQSPLRAITVCEIGEGHESFNPQTQDCKALRFFNGYHSWAQEVLAQGAKLTHLQLDPLGPNQVPLAQIYSHDLNAAQHLTCLNLTVTQDNLWSMAKNLVSALADCPLPNLVELILNSNLTRYAFSIETGEDEADFSAGSSFAIYVSQEQGHDPRTPQGTQMHAHDGDDSPPQIPTGTLTAAQRTNHAELSNILDTIARARGAFPQLRVLQLRAFDGVPGLPPYPSGPLGRTMAAFPPRLEHILYRASSEDDGSLLRVVRPPPPMPPPSLRAHTARSASITTSVGSSSAQAEVPAPSPSPAPTPAPAQPYLQALPLRARARVDPWTGVWSAWRLEPALSVDGFARPDVALYDHASFAGGPRGRFV